MTGILCTFIVGSSAVIIVIMICKITTAALGTLGGKAALLLLSNRLNASDSKYNQLRAMLHYGFPLGLARARTCFDHPSAAETKCHRVSELCRSGLDFKDNLLG